MNLIEQLGGYEKANGYLHELYKIPMHEQTEDTITWLPLLLLQYRREHNIFEVGDFVVLLHTNYRSDVFALTKSFKEIYDEKGIVYRHATDAEIKAGRRLSKIKCWSCDKEMSHSDRAENDGFCIHCNAEIEL